MDSNLQVDKQAFRACSEQGGRIKVSLEEPVRLAGVNVKPVHEAEAVILNRHYLGKDHIVEIRNSASSFNAEQEGACRRDGRAYVGRGPRDWGLLVGSCLMVVLGISSGTLLGRLYFTHGGTHRWVSTWTQTAGWPINLIPLLLSYCWFHVQPTPLTPKLALTYTAMGCITALDNLLYAWGISYLPASTNSLLCSSQLVFNVVFAYALVRQRITVFVANAVFTLTMGAILLGIHAEDDRPEGTTKAEYIVGFVATLCGAALYALILPLMELIFRRVVGRQSFVVVVETQTAISFVATCISMVGMSVHNDYAALSEEAAGFKLGSHMYTLTLAGCAVGWQLFFLGSAGIIFLTSSLMSCIFFTATLPLVPVLAVIIFHDHFSALKGIAMLLSMWGFVSYIYGGYLCSRVAVPATSLLLKSAASPSGRELDPQYTLD